MPNPRLEPLSRALQTVSIWLEEIGGRLDVDRHSAWHVLGAVLHTLRDRLSTTQTAHLGGQLPLIVRGYFYEQWHPAAAPKLKTREEFLARVKKNLKGAKIDAAKASKAVFAVLANHPKGEIHKIVKTLPPGIRALAMEGMATAPPSNENDTAESAFAWE